MREFLFLLIVSLVILTLMFVVHVSTYLLVEYIENRKVINLIGSSIMFVTAIMIVLVVETMGANIINNIFTLLGL